MSENILDIVREMREVAEKEYVRLTPDGNGDYKAEPTFPSFLRELADRTLAAFYDVAPRCKPPRARKCEYAVQWRWKGDPGWSEPLSIRHKTLKSAREEEFRMKLKYSQCKTRIVSREIVKWEVVK